MTSDTFRSPGPRPPGPQGIRARLAARASNERGDMLFEVMICIAVMGFILAGFVAPHSVATKTQRTSAGRNIAHQHAQAQLERAKAAPWATLAECADTGGAYGYQAFANPADQQTVWYPPGACPAGAPQRVTTVNRGGYTVRTQLFVTWHDLVCPQTADPGVETCGLPDRAEDAAGTKSVTIWVWYRPTGTTETEQWFTRTIERTSLPSEAQVTQVAVAP